MLDRLCHENVTHIHLQQTLLYPTPSGPRATTRL